MAVAYIIATEKETERLDLEVIEGGPSFRLSLKDAEHHAQERADNTGEYVNVLKVVEIARYKPRT